MRVALVYDRVNKWGGAERVLLALHEIWPEAPLFTAVYEQNQAFWAKDFNIRASFLNKWPLLRARHDWVPFLMPFVFESFDFDGFDLVISVTSAEAKGVITKPGVVHICYCLTPTRYLWGQAHEYLKSLPKIVRPVGIFLQSGLRFWDKVACNRPDDYIAISEVVARRVKKYYQRRASVVYPPVDVAFFAKKRRYLGINKPDSYYLLVSRLVVYKQVVLAIKAFNRLKLPLVIVGRGREAKKLKSMAGTNILFVDRLTDEELAGYYQNCRALLFPQDEDFGLVAVEAQASGKPVLAYRGGGALEIVVDGKTGEFFDEQSVEAIVVSVSKFERNRINYKSEDCLRNAWRFDKARFVREFRREVLELYTEHKNIWAGGVKNK